MNYADAIVSVILDHLNVMTKSSQRGDNKIIVQEVKDSPSGFTPEEFKDFHGISHEEYRHYAGDGMRCGSTVRYNKICRSTDYGGFNSGPAIDLITHLIKPSDEILTVVADPNGYSATKVRDWVLCKLSEMGV